MGVYLGCVQVFVTQKLLKCTYINAVLKHKRCGSVSELMGGIFICIQSGFKKILFNHAVDGFAAHPCAPIGQKKSIAVYGGNLFSLYQIVIKSIDGGIVKKNDALLSAFSEYPEVIRPNVGNVKANDLGDTQSAV